MIRKLEPFYVNQNDVYFENRKSIALQQFLHIFTNLHSGQEASPNA